MSKKQQFDGKKFPSGRPIRAAKNDAKRIARSERIPLFEAQNRVAKDNGLDMPWDQAVAVLCARHRTLDEHKPRTAVQNSQNQSSLARELGISDDELEQLSWDLDTNESKDGLVYCYILRFSDDCPRDVLDKIDGLSPFNEIRVSTWAIDEMDSNPELEDMRQNFSRPAPSVSQQSVSMNPYRKLLVMGVNAMLEAGVMSLDWDGRSTVDTGHLELDLAGRNAIVCWQDIDHGEIRVSVWWDYDHAQHPQANLEGNAKERFLTSSPLAKNQHYRRFVGVTCSGWLERKEGRYLQGKGRKHLFSIYTRRGELDVLRNLPDPVPRGFEPEGRRH